MYLMSKNKPIAKINFDTLQFDIIDYQLLPLALRGPGINILNFRDWLSERVLDISRSNAKKIINSLGLNQNNRIEICIACKGLSLTDCYWLKTEESKDTWENVNLYKNSLSKAIAKVALTGEFVSIQGRVRTPELTGGGAYAKCWRRTKDGLYLYKTGSLQGHNNEHMVEVICSNILDKLQVEHVKYTLSKTGLYTVSKCKNMCTEDLSICSADYFIGYCNRVEKDWLQWCTQQQLFFDMLSVDYILLNTDRHLGNWGVYIDTNTGQILKLHPLFDHNNCLYIETDIMSKVIKGKTLEECAKYAKSKHALNVEPLIIWLKDTKIKQKFRRIFHSDKEYKALMNRIKTYQKW